MAYTDLNPIRAQMAETPEESDFTSIKERIEVLQAEPEQVQQPADLMPFAVADMAGANQNIPIIDFHLSDYLELVDATGRVIREDKKGFIPDHIKPILNRLNLTGEGWFMMVKHLETDFAHAVGNEQNLNDFKPGRVRSFKGSAKAKLYYAA